MATMKALGETLHCYKTDLSCHVKPFDATSWILNACKFVCYPESLVFVRGGTWLWSGCGAPTSFLYQQPTGKTGTSVSYV